MSDILTLKETAEYLRVRREWRFFRSDIMEYLESTSRNRILSTKDEEANKDKKE